MFAAPSSCSKPLHRIRRDADALERERIGVEQILKRARAAPELPRERVEDLVERDRPGGAAAQLQVREPLAELAADRRRCTAGSARRPSGAASASE